MHNDTCHAAVRENGYQYTRQYDHQSDSLAALSQDIQHNCRQRGHRVKTALSVQGDLALSQDLACSSLSI